MANSRSVFAKKYGERSCSGTINGRGRKNKTEGRIRMEKLTMSVQELSVRMGISLPKAYALVCSPGFPLMRVGTRILIPVEGFSQWLMKTTEKCE